jgi:hypothetical protein
MNRLLLVLGGGGALDSTLFDCCLPAVRRCADEGGERAPVEEEAVRRPLDGLDDFEAVLDATFRG